MRYHYKLLPTVRIPCIHGPCRAVDLAVQDVSLNTIKTTCRNKHALPGIRCVIAVALALPLAIWYIPQLIGRLAADQPPPQPLLQASDLGTGRSANVQPAGQTAASLVAGHVRC
jgi:hypothetical protein